MNIRKLTLAEMQALYEEKMARDFPPEELRPFQSLSFLWEKRQYCCYACCEEERILAYAAFAVTQDAVLLDYFAVEKTLRGQGIGSRFLQKLKEFSSDFPASHFLIEVESVESAVKEEEQMLRSRRISFYERCGCIASGVYSLLFGVEYRILALPLKGKAPSSDQVHLGLSAIYQTLLSSLPLKREEWERVCQISPSGSFSKSFDEQAK